MNDGEALRLADIRMRDTCILADEVTQTYYAVSSTIGPRSEAMGRHDVRVLTSRDLVRWHGPYTVFQSTPDTWEGTSIRGIWAPEMHFYGGRYFLFLTFDTNTRFVEQWRDWRPRVKRASQVLWSDSPLGPFQPFASRPTLPEDMMTLDGTLWVEEGVPYMVFCHEWVQIKDGTVECIQLSHDLSEAVGEPFVLFHGSDATWNRKSPTDGGTVTDGPSLVRSKSGQLLIIWSSYGAGGYMVGVAKSESGSLRGPWKQHAEPLFADDGGHGMLFHRFDRQLMLILHQPEIIGQERARLFELEDLGDTLRIVRPFDAAPGERPRI